MTPIEQEFHDGRRKMICAFAALTTLALRAGVDEDAIIELHGEFFDGNVDIKGDFTAMCLRALLGGHL